MINDDKRRTMNHNRITMYHNYLNHDFHKIFLITKIETIQLYHNVSQLYNNESQPYNNI
jgi:hypothetical protein